MAELYFIRHGQASFGADDYDRLSTLGVKQCKALGQDMSGYIKDPVLVAGSLRRHKQSLEAYCDGASFTEKEPVIELPDFNEFDHEEVLYVAYPEFRDKRTLALELSKYETPKKQFHFIFQTALERWITGGFDQDYSESWSQFLSRVEQGLEHLRALTQEAPYKGRPLMVFTSGGPISGVCRKVMTLNDASTFALNENLANSGVTKLLSSEKRVSVSFINNYSHLMKEPGLVSYR
jgi:broad specificity phosphatase PhoE